MQLTGQAVQHAAFGKGVVTEQKNNIITVSFSQGEKRFVYPDAFKKFLTLNNEQAAEKVGDPAVTAVIHSSSAARARASMRRRITGAECFFCCFIIFTSPHPMPPPGQVFLVRLPRTLPY